MTKGEEGGIGGDGPRQLTMAVRRVRFGVVIEGDVQLGDWLNELLSAEGVQVGDRAGIRLTADIVDPPGAGLPPV